MYCLVPQALQLRNGYHVGSRISSQERPRAFIPMVSPVSLLPQNGLSASGGLNFDDCHHVDHVHTVITVHTRFLELITIGRLFFCASV